MNFPSGKVFENKITSQVSNFPGGKVKFKILFLCKFVVFIILPFKATQ